MVALLASFFFLLWFVARAPLSNMMIFAIFAVCHRPSNGTSVDQYIESALLNLEVGETTLEVQKCLKIFSAY